MAIQLGDVLGHELMRVVGLGPVATNLSKVGDRIVVPFPIACYRSRSREAGATHVIDYSKTDVHETLLELTGGRGQDTSERMKPRARARTRWRSRVGFSAQGVSSNAHPSSSSRRTDCRSRVSST